MPTEILPAGSIKTNFAISPEKTMSADAMDKTVVSGYDQDLSPKKKGGISPIILGIVGLLALFVIGGIAIGAAYFTGLIGGKPPIANGNLPPATPASSPGTTETTSPKPEMVQIPGGTFVMGRNKEPYEFGEHSVTVGNFAIGKTEVTNLQYLDFVKETNHAWPSNWSDGVPVKKAENRPVAFVSLDDAIAYANWRSVVDGVTYRLPTEEEWEYVARNGSKENLFPWGDQWKDGNAVVGKSDAEPEAVGSKPDGANIWGVLDLIGNVWEWTSSGFKPYPGTEGKVDQTKNVTGYVMIRGGSADQQAAKGKQPSTFRYPVPRDTKNKVLGFRLVRAMN
jgi:iron(II)-dependent oxidoreductase